jgi:ribosome-associated protein
LTSQKQARSSKSTDETLNNLIIDSIQDIKGKHIVKLDMRRLYDAPSDYFIICEGDSNTQVRAIANNIQKRVGQEMNINPNHVEGSGNNLWVLIDYFDTVVHVFYRETRKFYELEDLWGDAVLTEYENL